MSLFLPHFDDELFILPMIKEIATYIPKGEALSMNVFFFSRDRTNFRKIESLKALSQFNQINVVFLGDDLGIEDAKIDESINLAVEYLFLNREYLIGSSQLLCPVFEGGHRDHDALFEIVYSLKLLTNLEMYTFSAYNAYDRYLPLVVSRLKLGPVQGEIKVIKFSFGSGLWSYKQIFNYKTQWKILIFLLPGLTNLFFFRRKIFLLKVSTFDKKIPHPGPCFYDNLLKNRIKHVLGLKL